MLILRKKDRHGRGRNRRKIHTFDISKVVQCQFSQSFGKIINVHGVKNVQGFGKVLSELVESKDIYVLTDNDPVGKETIEQIKGLNIPQENKFKVGYKEFEDAFEPKVIYEAWKQFVESQGGRIGDDWTEEKIKKLREECMEPDRKFSKKLRHLNQGCIVSLEKPELAKALAEYCTENHLPEEICDLLKKLQEMI